VSFITIEDDAMMNNDDDELGTPALHIVPGNQSVTIEYRFSFRALLEPTSLEFCYSVRSTLRLTNHDDGEYEPQLTTLASLA
jgi:hypothetical protein